VSAVMIWNVLKLSLWTESPVVVVLSGSMEPSMYRGDILFLHKVTPIENGDIIVYSLEGENIPIVHRVTVV
jgi:signal peptidase